MALVAHHLHQEKGGLPLKEEIKQMKDKAFADLIVVAEPSANEGGKKKSSSPTSKPSAKKKAKTFHAARRGSSATKKPVIDLASPKGIKKTIESKPVKLAALKMATTTAERIDQRKGSVVPPVSWFVSKHASDAKSGLASEKLAEREGGFCY